MTCRVECDSVVLQFETRVATYSEAFDDSGIMTFPYNLKISESYSPDADLVGFIGNPDPTLYTGTQLGRSANFSTAVLSSDDPRTIEKVRMFARAMTRAYYRDPSGLGFWAWVVPKLDHDGGRMATASFEVTRIMGE